MTNQGEGKPSPPKHTNINKIEVAHDTDEVHIKMKKGDRVLIDPQVTGYSDFVEATVIDVEQNPFVGVVITAKTDDGVIFFEKEFLFKQNNSANVCMQ